MEKFSKTGLQVQETRAHRFLVGDRVIYHRRAGGCAALEGRHGRVIYRDTTEASYTVEFDEPIDGGITDERAIENGIIPLSDRGWFCREANLDPEENESVPPSREDAEKEERA